MAANEAGFDNLLDRCLAVREGERVVLLTDEGTDPDVVAGLEEGIARRGARPGRRPMPAPAAPRIGAARTTWRRRCSRPAR